MIKVGITGGETSTAGELIRLLVHHPEVEIETVYSPILKGRSLSSYHKGLIGEREILFSDALDFSSLDILFLLSTDQQIVSHIPPELKTIYIQHSDLFSPKEFLSRQDFVPGVSEMFRKRLVRGALGSRVVPPYTSISLVALFPLALHLLLNDSLSLKVLLPKNRSEQVDIPVFKKELESLLHNVQLSFDKIKSVEVENTQLIRAIEVEIEFDCGISSSELERIYEDIYDDHNFTFIMHGQPVYSEVSGTHKCLIYINKPSEDKVKIRAIGDGYLRGGAGDAIHTMNLMCGLYEKTGLTFPASLAF